MDRTRVCRERKNWGGSLRSVFRKGKKEVGHVTHVTIGISRASNSKPALVASPNPQNPKRSIPTNPN
jgi:hypothetical protein